MHSPEHAQDVQEARKLGGKRRKREVALAGAYDFEGLDDVNGIRRILEIATLDTLAMENSIPRNRTLTYQAQVALKGLEVGDTEERLAALEQAVHGRRGEPTITVFEEDQALLEAGEEESK